MTATISLDLIKSMTSNSLLAAYDAAYEVWDTCYKNVFHGDLTPNSDSWCASADELESSTQDLKALKAEILARKAAGTLYDGKRGIIKHIYEWAMSVVKDTDPEEREKHAYNITRKKMRDTYGVVMLSYYTRGVMNS